MSKVRVYEVAKQLNLDPKQVVALFQSIGVAEVRNHMSSVESDVVDRLKRHLEKQKTHNVVEERIRPTVVKRRAIAGDFLFDRAAQRGHGDRHGFGPGEIGAALRLTQHRLHDRRQSRVLCLMQMIGLCCGKEDFLDPFSTQKPA